MQTTKRLKKELTLFDVVAISTGAMFSSGFFLLPGLAAAKAGPSVAIAYLIAGILILPAMFSMAELSTAMPRAGGAYYFLDRSLGPLAGTIGGLGTYLALTLKTAFALIGIGAYAAIFMELPVKPVAITLTLIFMGLNIFGAKETTGLQRLLVSVLVGVLIFFIVQGLFYVFTTESAETLQTRMTPFLPFGVEGLLSTVGFVFVSYAGLTKVASVAEEIKNPARNIPLGMMISLAMTTFIYVVGVFIIVAVLDPAALHADLTPVATAGETFLNWLPQPIGLLLIVLAAIAAFASTGNAGLLSASRYPLAMARDRLIPDSFARLGRFQTPATAIVTTSGLMILVILALDEEGIAKLASAFQLLMFILINFAVIIMRESRIDSYDPEYRSPLYPWMQYFGMVTSLCLIVYMGLEAILLTLAMALLCALWYVYYGRKRVVRHGAIYHWFARLGQRRYNGLDKELWQIMREKGLRAEDSFDELVTRAEVIDLNGRERTYLDVVQQVSKILAPRLSATKDELVTGFMQEARIGWTPVSKGVSLPSLLLFRLQRPELVIVRSQRGIRVDVVDVHGEHSPDDPIHALFFLISPEEEPKKHLRFLAELAERTDEDSFMAAWLGASDTITLKAVLLHDEKYLSLKLTPGTQAQQLIDKRLRTVPLPDNTLVALIRRDNHTIVPRGDTVFKENDQVIVIGQPGGINQLVEKYAEAGSQSLNGHDGSQKG
jgi:amino acid transporter